jgi:hypothetical protein
MLSNQHFYHRTIRRNVIAFGTIFKHIQLARYAKDTYNELDRIVVPLSYGGKENFIGRLFGNPDLHKKIQILLPRMTFQMTGIVYDPTRKISSYSSNFNKVSGVVSNQQYVGVPYNLDFELAVYVRNVEDGTQIVEQIFPYFNPDYTLSMNFVDSMNITREVPIILESVDYSNTHEGDAETTVRVLIWTLKFKMKTFFFGPVIESKIIRKVNANTFIYDDSSETIFDLNLSSEFGEFKIGELVYVGNSTQHANGSATVVKWDANSSILQITSKYGAIKLNDVVHGSTSKASGTVVNVIPATQLMDKLVITPNPSTANQGDDFGFTTVLTEFPNV